MTTITINLDDTITIPLGRNSLYGTLDIEAARFPANTLEYIFNYGLKQVINDSMATKTDKDGFALENDAIAEKAVSKLAALYDGVIRMRGEAVAADAYEAEAIREAKRHITKVLSKAGEMRDIPKGTEDRMMFAINRRLVAQKKPTTTEADYLAMFFTTPVGKAIKARAIKTVDERRELESDVADLF